MWREYGRGGFPKANGGTVNQRLVTGEEKSQKSKVIPGRLNNLAVSNHTLFTELPYDRNITLVKLNQEFYCDG